MRLNAHLVFDGECEVAFKVYAQCFGGEIALVTYGSVALEGSPPEMKDKVVHVTLKVGDQVLTGADVASAVYEKPQGFAVQLNLDRAEEARRIFDVLAEGGVVHMALQKTFWAELYGVLTDRFGTPWEINCG